MAAQVQPKLTYEDWNKIPESSRRHELLDGALFVRPSDAPTHQRTLGRLMTIFEDYFGAARRGVVLHSLVGVVLSPHDVATPDLLVVTNPTQLLEHVVDGAPTLIVEILADETVGYDRVLKAGRYAACGVPHYWIVDRGAQVIECYRNLEGQFVGVARFSEEQFAHPDFDGLSFDVRWLWDPDWTR